MANQFTVYLEVNGIPTKEVAVEVIKKIEGRFDDLEYEINVCLSEYYQREK